MALHRPNVNRGLIAMGMALPNLVLLENMGKAKAVLLWKQGAKIAKKVHTKMWWDKLGVLVDVHVANLGQ
jgi:hypothetical protein